MKRALPTCCFLLLVLCSFAQTRGLVPTNPPPDASGKEKRIALVIGNSVYSKTGQTLKNPVNDANLMAATLEGLGFKVIKKLNTTKADMENALRAFEKQLPNYNVSLVYYAGHGIVGSNRDYLIPTDATVESPEDIKYDCIPVESITSIFNQYPDKTNILVLDACRNNPYRSWARSGASGFVKIEPSSGTIIGFATGEGSTASDGNGDNGLYTKVLAEEMKRPQQIEFVFKNTRKQVYDLSGHAQLPQDWNQLMGDFWFCPPTNKDETSGEKKSDLVSKIKAASVSKYFESGSEGTFGTPSSESAEYDGFSDKKIKIGDKYAGGYVFWLDSLETHGLVCEDAEKGGMKWDKAIDWCKSATLSGYSDWRLPSDSELEMIYQNLHRSKLKSFDYGSWDAPVFWGTIAGDNTSGSYQNFRNGKHITSFGRNFRCEVLAVRAF